MIRESSSVFILACAVIPADAVGKNKRRCNAHLFACKRVGQLPSREKVREENKEERMIIMVVILYVCVTSLVLFRF